MFVQSLFCYLSYALPYGRASEDYDLVFIASADGVIAIPPSAVHLSWGGRSLPVW